MGGVGTTIPAIFSDIAQLLRRHRKISIVAYSPPSVYTNGVLTKEEKQKSATAVQTHDKDTGSSAVQVSILTTRIQQLDDHLKKNHKDRHSRRGLVGLVEQRRKHLSYLKRKDSDAYESTVKKLKLRR